MDFQQYTSDDINLMGFDPVNYLAIDLLEQLDNVAPTKEEIDKMERLIKEKLKEITMNVSYSARHHH